jgi:hypothetical protein
VKLKIISISLLCLWIFQCTFSYLIYQVGRAECHVQNFAENTHAESTKHIHSFTFQKEEMIHWESEGKEFEKDGKMYDVVSLKNTKDGIVIICKSDTKEDSIIDTYHNHLKEKSKQNNHKNSIKKIIDLTCYNDEGFFANNPSACSNMTFNEVQNFIYSISLDIKSPPPKG